MTLSTAPRVTFVVPCFNETPAILLESLTSIAAQDFKDFECLVIDESTKSESVAACEAFCQSDPRFRRIAPTERIGLAASLNLGLAEAQGEYIARFDSDDICLPCRLRLQVGEMDTRPEVGVLGGGLEIVNNAGESLAFRRYPLDHNAIARSLQTTTPIAHPTAMIRRSVIERIGGYDASFRFAEDLDLWLRMLNSGVRFANLSETLVHYRQQNTRRDPDHWRYNLRARRKNFARSYFPFRLVGMAIIGLWIYMPSQLQQTIFRLIVLSTSHKLRTT